MVLRNDEAPRGERRLVLTGTFQGFIVGFDENTGVSTLNHVLSSSSGDGQVITGPDIGVPIGGDGVTTLEVVETLKINTGTGAYANAQAGGTITLKGTLGLETGINSFRVEAVPGDEVCFSDD